MPSSQVVATLPFSAALATRKTKSASHNRIAFGGRFDHFDHSGGPSVLSIEDSRPLTAPFVHEGESHTVLLEEACDLARTLGYQLRRRLLGGAGGGHRWFRGRMQIVLDVESTPADRLAVVADALRGEPRLAVAQMSPELAAYLQPRRAA